MFLISKALPNCCISIKQQIIEVATISGSGFLSKEHAGSWSYIPYFTQAGEEYSAHKEKEKKCTIYILPCDIFRFLVVSP